MPGSCGSLWNLKATNRFYNISEQLSPESKNIASEFARTRHVTVTASKVSKIRKPFPENQKKEHTCFMRGTLQFDLGISMLPIRWNCLLPTIPSNELTQCCDIVSGWMLTEKRTSLCLQLLALCVMQQKTC